VIVTETPETVQTAVFDDANETVRDRSVVAVRLNDAFPYVFEVSAAKVMVWVCFSTAVAVAAKVVRLAVPPEVVVLVAVSATAKYFVMSAATGVYESPVAPEIATQSDGASVEAVPVPAVIEGAVSQRYQARA
jgi:hypothetical protein